MKTLLTYLLLLLIILAALFFIVGRNAYAEIDVERLADAIYKAENSDSKPYGIMKPYCKPNDPDGQCRKGCIQTINKRLRMYQNSGSTLDFITYLGKTYCPTTGDLRPAEKQLNRYWATNVKYFYKKEVRG